MILAIDAGNTNISFGLIKDGIVAARSHMPTLHGHDLAHVSAELLIFTKGIVVEGCIISTVVPRLTKTLEEACVQFNCPVYDIHAHDLDIPLKTAGVPIDSIGADLIACAVAAIDKYQVPALILDMGTATTLTYVNDKSEFAGVSIAPGLELSMKALNIGTALLPEINVAKPAHIIGKNTVEAMQGGIYYGYTGLINSLINESIKQLNCPLKVIATGGWLNKVKDDIECLDIVDENLIFHGLQVIFKHNNKFKLGKVV